MLTVIGLDGSPPPEAARAALRDAALVVGDPRHLAGLPVSGARTVPTRDPAAALDGLDAREQNVAVVVEGDPGFFGIVRDLRERGHAPRVLPGVSLVARAFARAGLPWEDALVVSARDGDLRRAVNTCRAHPKVAVLTGPGAGPAELARALFPQTPRSFVVCEDLDGPEDRVVHVRPAEATTRPWHDPEVVLVLDDRRALGETGRFSGTVPGPDGWALPRDAFGGPPSLGPEARAFILARLAPRLGDMVWDVASGDGAVGIECARFGAAVVAVDPGEAVCERIRRDVRGHGVKVAVSRGEVPDVLGHLPEPDAVFAGRGGPETVRACAAHALARVVAVAASAQAGPIVDVLAGEGFTAGAVRIEVTALAGSPASEPAGPVVVVWGERGARASEPPRAEAARPVETLHVPFGGLAL